MADETKSPPTSDSMKTVQALAIILILILAIFMVTSLNGIKGELVKMNQQVDVLITTTAQNCLAGYQAVDEDGNLEFRFAPVPMMEAPAGVAGSGPGAVVPLLKK
jgi:hypothetical protein